MSLVTGKTLRKNLIDLKKNYPNEFGRYIKALRNLELSEDWPRVCGIHGNTFKPDDAGVLCATDPEIVEKIGNTPDEPFYCAHGETRFVAWHTPYIYQYELLLNKYNTSEDKSYISLPYLYLQNNEDDYSFVNEATITILYDGNEITMENPLAAENVKYYNEKGEYKVVSRNGFLSPKDTSEVKRLNVTNKELNNVLYTERYPTFSSNAVMTTILHKLIDYNPIEIPHNTLHDIIGGEGGNMSEVSISAYDPLFWMHHCNIDRFFYNWMYRITDGFKKTLSFPRIPEKTQHLTLAPFDNVGDGVYSADYETYPYGWKNNKLSFTRLEDVLDFKKYPYTYEEIERKPYEMGTGSVEIFGMPIPLESTHIEALIYPKEVELTKENRNEYIAGSVSWFGINRYHKNCKRCNKSRTNLKIDVSDYLKEKNINVEDLKNYNWKIEGKGRLEKDEKDNYRTYNQSELLKDGKIDLYVYGPYRHSIKEGGSNMLIQILKGIGNMLGLREKGK